MTDEPEKTPEPISAAAEAPSGPAKPAGAKPAGATAAGARPAGATPAGAAPVGATASASEGRRVLPLLNLAGFVILAGAIGYLWTRPQPVPPMPVIPPDQSGLVSALKGQVANLQSSLSTLDAREKQDIATLRQQIAALPAAPASSAGAPPAAAPSGADQGGNAALAAQIAALQQRLAALESSTQAAAQKAQAAPSADSVAALSNKLDGLGQREAGDTQSIRQTLAALQQQLSDLSDKARSLSQDTQKLPQLAAQSARLGQVLQAEDALAAGKPLGSIAGAPPALAAYATTAPPTEAALRLAYPAAARAAEKAGAGQEESGGFWHRVWLRVQTLVTLRQGDRVIVGDQTGGILAHAQRLLDAGDLSGAVTVLGTLQGPAAAAMASWTGEARGLIAARQALAQMAAQ